MSHTITRNFRPTIDLRAKFHRVQNQGARPTCVAFAVTACHEATAQRDKLSEEFLYRCCKIKDQNDNDGTYVPVALENLAQIGQVLATEMGYVPVIQGTMRNFFIPLHQFRIARRNRIQNWIEIPPVPNEVEAKLTNGLPVVTVLEVQTSFMNVHQTEGFIDLPTLETYKDAYHAVVLVGYGLDNQNSPYFLMRNSWGERWGESGYAYLSYSYFQNYQYGAWAIS